MISALETMARLNPNGVCFTFVDADGTEQAYTYRQVRLTAAALACQLQKHGVGRGDCISVDLPNLPAWPLLLVAAAYGNFAIVAINNRLTSAEKIARLLELDRLHEARVAFRVDEGSVDGLLRQAQSLLVGDWSDVASTVHARSAHAVPQARMRRQRGRAAAEAQQRRARSVYPRDAEESVIHVAERAAHVFDPGARALVMFTSGTTGKYKAVPLTWNNLIASAQASNASLARSGEGMWQAALPLCHIGGLQVVVRSLCNHVPFMLYRRFDARRLLFDAVRNRATHVSVVDKMLQDMLAVEEETGQGSLRQYACILLGGGAANPKTLGRARAVGARVFASYGMTETSSHIASALVTDAYDGGMSLLPGYRACVVDPNEQGFGRLAVKGPGVFEGYLNARAAHTLDGFFLTGDTAALRAGRLFVKERTQDMFVSGGENIYPAEIAAKLMGVPGVADAYVFGAADPVWGRRPVAFVERGKPDRLRATGAPPPTPQQAANLVRNSLAPRLSRLYLPRHVCVLDEFPRTGIGKVDRAALEALYEQRIEVRRVTLYHVKIPFTTPFKTAKATLHSRESIIVEVTDHAGRRGLGECTAFPTDWYLPETLGQDAQVLQQVIAPRVLREVYLHPSEVSASLLSCAEAAGLPLARGALEPALWDLYGTITGKPLWQLIGGAAGIGAGGTGDTSGSVNVAAGAVVGIASVAETVEAARRCSEAGYRRVKLKVSPGTAYERTRAVRAALPDLMISLDANQSFSEREAEELRALDGLDVQWIEEPLDPARPSAIGPTDLFARLARLQRTLATPLCLDESITCLADVDRALSHPELRCVAVKIGKFGGVQPTLDFVRKAAACGVRVWMGGMYDTGISKRLHAAFQTLPGIDDPGDIGSVTRYFPADITVPPHTAERGLVTLNRGGYAHGLGCGLDPAALSAVLVSRVVIE